MLTEIRLDNFKCFSKPAVVPTKRLTLLTGINARGKSTVLQALLIMHQSIERALAAAEPLDKIDLNGRYARLGTFRDVQNLYRSKGDHIALGFEFTDPSDDRGDEMISNLRLSLAYESDDVRFMHIQCVEVERRRGRGVLFEEARERVPGDPPLQLNLGDKDDKLATASQLLRLSRIHYIGADRVGPEEIFRRSDIDRGFVVGARGEWIAEVLYQLQQGSRTLSPEDKRYREESDSYLISEQVNAWLAYIFDGGKVKVTAPHSTILTLEMNSDGSAHYHRPANVGFGYSYALPILVAGLVAKPGEILIVENPEAHLHPLAQSRLSEFLATVASAGVQVFVESHSEHTLNAFRLAVKEKQIGDDDLSVLYFLRDAVDPIQLIEVDADGKIKNWPDGFFDQRSKDFFKLFGQ